MAAEEHTFDPEAERLPRAELEELQVGRVRACVERLRASDNAFYRERLEGVRPEDLRSIRDLERLPFTEKNDLRDHYPFGLFLAPLRDVVRIHASSGSTGKPAVVGYTERDLRHWAEVLARGLVAGGLGEDDVFQNAFGYGLFTGGLGFHGAATRIGLSVVPTSVGNTPRQVMLMRDFGVTAFCATPSYALQIAEVAAAEGVDVRSLPVRAAFLGAEPMSMRLRCEIEDRMGVSVYEQYGLSEIIGPGVAWGCSRREGMHVQEDHFILELVDPETGRRVPDGETGELVFTAPTKEAFPLLRYRTRDRARLLREPCACGRTFVRIERILGRTDDMLIVRGVNVFPSQIEHALLGVKGLEPQYQIVLATRADRQDEIRVRVEAAPEAASEAADRAALEARVREVLRGADVVVHAAALKQIPHCEQNPYETVLTNV
ncbi:MAG: phenylacetate--CoA ligase family protein, partial [Candidatus Binatia bacterium]